MPAAEAMSSTVVCSNPCRSNRSNATCSRSAREVSLGRPVVTTLALWHWVPLLCVALGAIIGGTLVESAVLAPEVVSEPDEDEAEAPLIEELLVEEVSIDGMCGVY